MNLKVPIYYYLFFKTPMAERIGCQEDLQLIIKQSQVQVVSGAWCCVLKLDNFSSVLNTGSTQENVLT